MPDSVAPTPRDLSEETLTALARRALDRSGRADSRIVRLRLLDGGSDRNAVARAFVESPGGPVSVIVKAPYAFAPGPPPPDAPRRAGFVREWSALRLIDRRAPATSSGPRFVAGDAETGVMVLRDIGDHETLVGTLTGTDPATAGRALVDLAIVLGELHAGTVDCAAEHAALSTEAFPDVAPGARPSLPAFERAANALVTRLGGEVPGRELAELAALWDKPGRWTALVHGDPCPDNVLRVSEDHVELVDFEFADPGHALCDVSWWHMGFPSCWCAGTVPRSTVARADDAYRRVLATAIPACTDDDVWADELACLCTLQLLASAPRVLDAALDDDAPWGTARHRERLLHWLHTCARMLDERQLLPGFRRAIDGWTTAVGSRPPDRGALTRYPAFASVPTAVDKRLAMAVVVRDGRVLVQRRWRRGTGFTHEFPGGHVNPDESWVQAATRELVEETGLEESRVVHESVARSREDGTIAFVVFDSSSETAPARTVESRHQQFLWLLPADIPTDDLEPADALFASGDLPALVARLRE